MQGSFDQLIDGRAIGWVFSPDAPGTRLEVEILCNDRVVARGLAHLERADLAQAGIGDGRHGFDLSVDLSLCQGDPPQLIACEAYSGQILTGSPRQAKAIASGQEQAPAIDAHTPPDELNDELNDELDDELDHELDDESMKVHGHFDDLLHGNADGWVYFPNQPHRRADVEVLCDGRVVARGQASRLRPDLQEAGIGDGHCAFSLPIDPLLFDGQPHQLLVREPETGTILDGSPKVLQQAAIEPLSEPLIKPLTDEPQTATEEATLVISRPRHLAAPGSSPYESALSGASPEPRGDSDQAAKAAKPEMTAKLEGRLEAVRHGHIEGWAFDPRDPTRRLEIEVLCDGQVQGRSVADLYRQDLAEAGVGDGRHAFALPLSSALRNAGEHELVVRECQSGQPLEGSPLVWRMKTPQLETPEQPEPPQQSSELQGRFEGILNGQVCGWAIDPLRPEMRVELEILCDGEPIARTRADLEREDLAEVALGDGRHGFRLTLDARLFDGQPHDLSVRALRTQQLLPGSPQRLQSEAPPARVRPADVQGAFEAISGTRALGYAWDLSRPEHRLEVEILCEGRVVGRAPANSFRQDLYASGIGDGRHAFSVPISYELFDAKPHWLTAREAHTGKSLTHGPHLFEQASANWSFDLMPRSETLKQLEVLLAEPDVASRTLDAEQCRERLLEACLRQEMRQTEAARAIYRQLLEQLGENALCHCKLAETWLLDGEPDPALDAYRQAASLPSPLFWAYLGVGNAFKLRDQFVEAEDAYQSALRMNPRQSLVLLRLDEVRARAVPIRVDRLVAEGRLDEGIRLLKTRLIEEPENLMILDKLSTLLARHQGPPSGSAVDEDEAVIAFDNSLRVLELLLAEGDLLARSERSR